MAEIIKAFDGWENLFTGRGVSTTDRRLSTTFKSKALMQEGELNQLYADNGFAARVVDKYVEAMVQKGWKVNGDQKDLVIGRLDELKAWPWLEKLLRWNRLHGGAVLVLNLDDGRAASEPLNEANLRRIISMRVYDRWRVQVQRPVALYDDPRDPKYGEVRVYTISPLDGLPSQDVHESRCLVLDGMDIPDRVRQLNQWWGLSFLQRCFEQLRQIGEVYDDIEDILADFVTQTVTMEGLMEKLAAGKESLIQRRLHLIDMSRATMNTVLLDKEEEFAKQASTVSGLAEVLDRYLQALSIVTGMPARVLLGQQGGGLNNEGEGETRDWYDTIASEQVRIYKPRVLERLVRLVMLERQGPFKGRPLAEWFIEFEPLYQMSKKEVAEIRKINADMDVAYVQNGILDPAEVAISRFGGAKYGDDIELDTLDRRPPEGELEDTDDDDKLKDEPGADDPTTTTA